MSEYKGIKGFQVQTRTEDPTDGIAGDFYYNSSTGQFKTVNTGGAPIGTWASSTACLLYTSPSPRDPKTSRMPSSA